VVYLIRYFHMIQSKPGKRKRGDIRTCVAMLIAPKYTEQAPGDIESMDWEETDAEVGQTQKWEDEMDLHVVTLAISRGNPKRAGCAISLLLSRSKNKDVKDEVLKSITAEKRKDDATKDLIIDGIRESIEYHTTSTGTRHAIAEMFIKFVVAACLFSIVSKGIQVADHCLSRVLGTTIRQISSARRRVAEMIENNTFISEPARKTRKDRIRDKLRPFIFKFLLDDDSITRLDTNQGKVDVIDPSTEEIVSVHRRIWTISNREQQHLYFLESDLYKQFQTENVGATVGYSVWRDVLLEVGTFVSEPIAQSCVDEKISFLEHLMAALLPVLRRKNVKKELQKYQPSQNELTYDELYSGLRKAGAYQFLDKMCCPKDEQPKLDIIESSSCPKMIPLECTHGKNGNKKDRCTKCGVRKVQGLLAALLSIPELADEFVEVMVWQDSVRMKKKDGTVATTQRELKPKDFTIRDLVKKLQDQIELCIPHYQEICWMRHLMETDFKRLPPSTLLICTDFASSMTLRAFRTVNSHIRGSFGITGVSRFVRNCFALN